MRKRFNLVFILILGVVMLLSLVACNQSATKPGDLPDNVGGNNSSAGTLPENSSAGLKFTFPVEMSSIFNSIYVDEFNLSEYVEYSVVYYNEAGAVLKEIPYGGVTEGMVAEDDRQYLSVAGHHKIHVTAELDDNTTASGVFDLHLKNRGAISLSKYTFLLEDENGGGLAYPYFGTMNADQDQVTVSIEQGVTFNTWEEFTRVFQLSINGKALLRVSGINANTTYSATNGFPFTVGADETFRIAFTDDVVRVTYDINLPDQAKLKESVTDENNPQNVFAIDGNGKYSNVYTQRGVGYAPQPSDEEINLYHGYTFSGWFDKSTGKLWRFSSTVGETNLQLEAHWALTEYSLTVYTMGGVFVDGLENYELKINDNIVNESNVSSPGINMNLVQSTSRFSLSTGELNRITFTGFKYDMDYDKCVAMVTVNSKGDKVMLKVSDFYEPNGEGAMDVLTKGGHSFVIDELYSDYQCTEPVNRGTGKVNDDQPVTYVKWIFDEPNTSITNYYEIYLDRISNYIANVIFKDGYKVLADGSVRLEQISDWTVNELIIPAEIRVDGEIRKITEIADRALSNAKAITKLDLSRAENLTTIGAEAFAHDVYLAYVDFPEPSKNNITNIGDRAFYDTAFEDKYSENHKGAEFIVIGTMIYKYVGNDRTEIDLSNSEDDIGRVTSIEAGAFARCPSLETLKLPYTVTTIRNNALSGLENFQNLVIKEAPTAETASDDEGDGGESGDDGEGETEPEEPSPEEPGKVGLLLDIGETAFDGTAFLSESGNLYVPEFGAIIIGNVYYRFLNKNATTADIPDKNDGYVITHIAPQAFEGCTKIEKITGNEQYIVSIGKNAFTETAILRVNKENKENPTLYTVYNHILTDYYGNLQDPNGVDLVIPNNVYTIATNAFGQYGRYFETVQIGASVTRIENYAFSGANMLTKVILTGVTVNSDATVLIGAPSIGEYAFADSYGELRSGMKIYFNDDVIKAFEGFVNTGATPEDKITAEWVNLYKMHKDVFEEEGIGTVTIDRNKIASVLMQTSVGSYESGQTFTLPFKDTYGETVTDALIIRSKTGVTRYDSLDVTKNKLALILLQDPATVKDDKFANCYVEGGVVKYDYSNLWNPAWSKDKDAKHYVVYYFYEAAPDKCMVDPESDVFIVTVYEAIDGTPNFTDLSAIYKGSKLENMVDGVNDKNANDYINLDENTATDKFWFTGLDGEIAGAELPTYYTSYTGFRNNDYSSVVFHYIDVNGVHRTLAPSRITNLITTAEGNEFTAQIEVSFYGIGTFKFEYTYSVKTSRYKAIEQTKTINIPVNANATDYLLGYPLNLVGEDGNVTPVNIVSNVFSHIDTFNTSTLGMHSATVNYTDMDAVGTLSCVVWYTVVLEADENMFAYSIIRDSIGDSIGEAAITGFNTAVVNETRKKNITTLVLPSKCMITAIDLFTGEEDTKEYKITQIGAMGDTADGVFEGLENLTAVYLPETLECIGVNAFNGCKSLKYVYTAIQADSTALTIDRKDYFTPFGNTYTEMIEDENGVAVEWTIQPVKLTSVGKLDSETKELIIASDYKVSELRDGDNGSNEIARASDDKLIYRIVAVEIEQLKDLNRDEIDVYLPDTIYYPVSIKDSQLYDVTPLFYKSGNNFMIKTQNHVPDKLVTIGKGSFRDCISLESIDLTYATSLMDIGTGAFSGSGLKSFDLSHNTGVTEIQSSVFEGCEALEKVVLHSGITAIGERAFKLCTSLKTVEGTLINLEFIGEMAFNQAKSLTRFDIYKKDATIQSGAFAMCRALTIYCHFDEIDDSWNSYDCPIVWNCDSNEIANDNMIYYVAENGLRYALDKDTEKATVANQMSVLRGDIVIPSEIQYDGVTYKVATISDEAFMDNVDIVSVTVSSELKTIGAKAFSGCTGLLTFKFSDKNGLERIAATAFDGCTALAEKPQHAGVATNEIV